MRAKRNEQPESEFWVRFEREFKQKQKLLIQRQLVSETGLKSPFATRFYKLSAFTATCGIAAAAVYIGFQTPVSEELTIVQNDANDNTAPHFSVAVASAPAAKTVENAGLQEFATLAQTSAPRIIVEAPNRAEKAPTPAQITVLKTLASLEDTIQAKRANDPAPTPSYHFVSSNGLFETELTSTEEEPLEDVWDFENAYRLGKYADPLTGTFSSNHSNHSISDIQNVSFSQIEDALTSKSSRSNRSIDALTLRF